MESKGVGVGEKRGGKKRIKEGKKVARVSMPEGCTFPPGLTFSHHRVT